MKWHGGREEVFELMRQVDEMALLAHAEYLKLCPNGHSRLPVGSADFDYYLRYEVYSAFVRALNRGMSPDEAYKYANDEGRECVRLWNERGYKSRVYINNAHELKRYENSAEPYALAVLHIFRGIPDPLEPC